jgi:beta-lactamase superfamily II metal-dependent hydrolase
MLTSLALAFLPPSLQTKPDILEVTSIDVGEGDAISVVAPQGRTLLVNAVPAQPFPTWGQEGRRTRSSHTCR